MNRKKKVEKFKTQKQKKKKKVEKFKTQKQKIYRKGRIKQKVKCRKNIES